MGLVRGTCPHDWSHFRHQRGARGQLLVRFGGHFPYVSSPLKYQLWVWFGGLFRTTLVTLRTNFGSGSGDFSVRLKPFQVPVLGPVPGTFPYNWSRFRHQLWVPFGGLFRTSQALSSTSFGSGSGDFSVRLKSFQVPISDPVPETFPYSWSRSRHQLWVPFGGLFR